MADISTIDKNLKITEAFGRDDIVLYDVRNAPFAIRGVFYEGNRFRRMPKAVAATVNGGVLHLSLHTSGGRVFFSTDSECIALTCTRPDFWAMGHMARTGNGGFTLYERRGGRWVFRATFVPPASPEGFSSIVDLGDKAPRELMLQMPLYAPISSLLVGISDGSELRSCKTLYEREKPIVFYGSSITQGGCASSAGSDYAGRVSRYFDTDYINLGFSGSARGEDVIADYIKDLPMSLFVLDYDHNAANVEELKNTHEKLYKKVRGVHPEIPIIIMSRPKYYLNPEEEERLSIIKATYENALSRGEKVYFLDGRMLMEFAGDEGTVDNCHPTDYGFASMAKSIIDVMKGIL